MASACRRKSLLGLLLTASLFFSSMVLADIVSTNPRPRAIAMGGAGLALSGGPDSAVMNPAGLADVTSARIEAFPLVTEIPMNLGLAATYLDYNDVRGSSNPKPVQKQAFSDFVNDANATSQSMRINVYPSYTRPYLHAGLLMDFTAEAEFFLGGLPSNQAVALRNSGGTFGLIMGGGYSFFQNSLQAGVTLKPLYKIALADQPEQTCQDILVGNNPDRSVVDQIFGAEKASKQGFGLGVDVGIKYWLPNEVLSELRPALGVTYQDIGDTRFLTDDVLPEDTLQSLSIGAAIHPNWGISKNAFAIDLRNINQDMDAWHYIHLGAESIFRNSWIVRAGIAQGYVSGGLGFISQYFEADFFVSAREAARKTSVHSIRTLGLKLSLVF